MAGRQPRRQIRPAGLNSYEAHLDRLQQDDDRFFGKWLVIGSAGLTIGMILAVLWIVKEMFF